MNRKRKIKVLFLREKERNKKRYVMQIFLKFSKGQYRMNQKKRCSWCNLKNPNYIEYHDKEWCVPNFDDKYLYEMIIFKWSAIVATVCIIIDIAIITLLSMRRFRNAIRRRLHF